MKFRLIHVHMHVYFMERQKANPLGSNTWSTLGRQNLQAKNVCYQVPTDFSFECYDVIYEPVIFL